MELRSQYTYFNNVYGEFGDQETEATTNVEVIRDTLFLFGGIANEVKDGCFDGGKRDCLFGVGCCRIIAKYV